MAKDDLRMATGVMVGICLGVALWLIVLGLAWLVTVCA